MEPHFDPASVQQLIVKVAIEVVCINISQNYLNRVNPCNIF